MDKLIRIAEIDGKSVVSARELYKLLGYDTSNWKKWYVKNITSNDYAIENEDYTELVLSTRTRDFALTIDFSKKLSMLARTEKGDKVRSYFISVEKKLKEVFSLPTTFSEALRQLADTTEEKEKALIQLHEKTKTIEENASKVVFADSVVGSSNSILIRQFAKDLCDDNFKIGQNRVFEWLRENKYLQANNEPYQNYIQMGLFEVITRSIGSGEETFTSRTTKVTGKGAVYFAKKIKS